MEQRKNEERTPQGASGVKENESSEQGRVAGSQQPAAKEKSSDISQVDQQEGQMNNGELGGAPEVPVPGANK